MARRTKARELVETTLGQHLALSVAAHLARTQLVPDPLNVYDGEHLIQSVDAIANALLRVTPLYSKDPGGGEPRQLTDAELVGARVSGGAQNLVLRDGRNLSAVTIKRADLRQAITILRSLGMPELTHQAGAQKSAPSRREPDRKPRLVAQLDEIEGLLAFPLVPAQVERANRLAIAIARSAPSGSISNLAMRLLSAIHEARGGGDEQNVRVALARLRCALDEVLSRS